MSAQETTDAPLAAVTHLGPDGAYPPELRDLLASTAGTAVAGANIVMQLASLGVGHGVAESRVESGSLYAHPIKRARTTFSYVAVALLGTDEERQEMARVVTEVHRHVRNLPGEEVRYTALDPKLQLWVAACIYKGMEDAYTIVHGPPSVEVVAKIYPHAARLATTLQVPADMWPPDREAFEEYWDEAVRSIRMDDVTRAYLWDFTGLGFLPWPVPQLVGRFHRTITTGALPEAFRRELGLPWGRRQQRVWDANARVLKVLDAVTPKPVRRLPMDLYLWDVRRRIRKGHALV